MLTARWYVGNPAPGGTVDHGCSSWKKLSRVRRLTCGTGTLWRAFIFPAHEAGAGLNLILPVPLTLTYPSFKFLSNKKMETKILLGLYKHSKMASLSRNKMSIYIYFYLEHIYLTQINLSLLQCL